VGAGPVQHRRPLAHVELAVGALPVLDAIAIARAILAVVVPAATRLLVHLAAGARTLAVEIAPQPRPRAREARARMEHGRVLVVVARPCDVAGTAIARLADDRPGGGIDGLLLAGALGVEVARLADERAVGADAGLIHAARTILRRRRRDRPGTLRAFPAA